MDRMTPEERIAYAHGSLKRDMSEFEDYIIAMRERLKQARTVWIVSAVVSILGMATTAALAKLQSVRDWAIFVFVAAMFTIQGGISYAMFSIAIRMAKGLTHLLSHMIDDTSLRFGFEEMRLDGLDVKTQPIAPSPASVPGEGGKRTE